MKQNNLFTEAINEDLDMLMGMAEELSSFVENFSKEQADRLLDIIDDLELVHRQVGDVV